MNSLIASNIQRFIGLVLLQGIILRNIGVGWESTPYLNILVYPLFVMLLPLRLPATVVIFIGFVTGIVVDFFYNSIGVHAAALTFSAFFRSYILDILRPPNDYNKNYSPTASRFGRDWFLQYAGVFLFIHCFAYFSIEAFSPYFWVDIIVKSIVGFILSYGLVLLLHFLFNSEE